MSATSCTTSAGVDRARPVAVAQIGSTRAEQRRAYALHAALAGIADDGAGSLWFFVLHTADVPEGVLRPRSGIRREPTYRLLLIAAQQVSAQRERRRRSLPRSPLQHLPGQPSSAQHSPSRHSFGQQSSSQQVSQHSPAQSSDWQQSPPQQPLSQQSSSQHSSSSSWSGDCGRGISSGSRAGRSTRRSGWMRESMYGTGQQVRQRPESRTGGGNHCGPATRPMGDPHRRTGVQQRRGPLPATPQLLHHVARCRRRTERAVGRLPADLLRRVSVAKRRRDRPSIDSPARRADHR
jgi:hypothetical protein